MNSTKEWLIISDDSQALGPFTLEEIRERKENLKPDTLLIRAFYEPLFAQDAEGFCLISEADVAVNTVPMHSSKPAKRQFELDRENFLSHDRKVVWTEDFGKKKPTFVSKILSFFRNDT